MKNGVKMSQLTKVDFLYSMIVYFRKKIISDIQLDIFISVNFELSQRFHTIHLVLLPIIL